MQGRSKKKEVFTAVHMGLIDQGMLEDDETSGPCGSPIKGAGSRFVSVSTGLSFAEQKELLAMQMQEVRLELEWLRQERPNADVAFD